MILITGASGFVGSNILKLRSDAIAAPSLKGMREYDVMRIFERFEVDTVIHTAAIADTRACQENPSETLKFPSILPALSRTQI